MVADRTDEALRRIVFGRGSSPEEIAAASAELRRRSSASADEIESPTEEASSQSAVEASSTEPAETGPFPRVHRRWLPFVLTAVLAALLGGLVTAAALSGSVTNAAAPVSTDAPGVDESGSNIFVSNASSGQIVYQVPNNGGALSDRVMEGWFDEAQQDRDALPSSVTGLDISSSRYVGLIGDLYGVWIARGQEGEYCLVVGLRDEGGATAGSSCADADSFAESGVYVGTGKYTAFWNQKSLIMSATSSL